jgi:hypothetical protein
MLPVKGQPGNNYYQVRWWVSRRFPINFVLDCPGIGTFSRLSRFSRSLGKSKSSGSDTNAAINLGGYLGVNVRTYLMPSEIAGVAINGSPIGLVAINLNSGLAATTRISPSSLEVPN